MLKYFDTPIIQIHALEAENQGIRLLVKREDLNHPRVSGNKWWKLKYNIQEAVKLGHHTVLTFGGAFSNHIYATAGAAYELGLKSIGVVRGEEVLPLNSTLAFARQSGMRFHFVARDSYRAKAEKSFADDLRKKFGDFYLIPEGGTNELAVRGCEEFGKEKLAVIDCDYVCLPVGTGGTMAGIIAGLEAKKNVIGFSVLKGGDFLSDEIKKLLRDYPGSANANWSLQADYHFGGYAKQTTQLRQLISTFEKQHNLPLDPIYTGKMVAGVLDLLKRNYFAKGSTILLIHTGGLQTR